MGQAIHSSMQIVTPTGASGHRIERPLPEVLGCGAMVDDACYALACPTPTEDAVLEVEFPAGTYEGEVHAVLRLQRFDHGIPSGTGKAPVVKANRKAGSPAERVATPGGSWGEVRFPFVWPAGQAPRLVLTFDAGERQVGISLARLECAAFTPQESSPASCCPGPWVKPELPARAAAEPTPEPEPEPEAAEPERNRDAEGQYVGDDPATPEVDEAWRDPDTKKPVRRTRRTKSNA